MNNDSHSLDEGDIRFLSDGNYDATGTSLHDAVMRVLSRLPDEIVEWTKDNVAFYAQSGAIAASVSFRLDPRWVGHHFVPRDFSDQKPVFEIRIIFLHEDLERVSSAEQDYVVAHELAHAWLGHITAFGLEAHQRKEEEADSLANDWGFTNPRQ